MCGDASHVALWCPEDAPEIYQYLEEPCWRPWLRSPERILARYPVIFPDGQLMIRSAVGTILATVTMNRINWDGNPDTLPSWDEVAGAAVGQGDYASSFVPHGNTIVLMSMNVRPDQRGNGHPRRLIAAARAQAHRLGVRHLIAPFRPDTFGKWKLEDIARRSDEDFQRYCQLKIERNGRQMPFDGWIRNLIYSGMMPIRVQNDAMVVTVSRAEFEEFRKQGFWIETRPGEWQCGETGTWYVRGHTAVYREKNLWGRFPL
jgi:GNAT superfamily N-acetyltransferase